MPTSRLARAVGPVVGVTGGTSLVVEAAGAGARREGGEGPHPAGVGEAAVTGVAGEHDSLLARRSRDG